MFDVVSTSARTGQIWGQRRSKILKHLGHDQEPPAEVCWMALKIHSQDY